MVTNNSCNYSPVQFDVQAGGANGTLSQIAPGVAGTVLTSNGVAALPTFQAAASAIQTIDGDSGSVSGSTITIYADNVAQGAGSTVSFVNSGTVSKLNVTDTNQNTIIGKLAGNASVSGGSNTGVGAEALNELTTGSGNTAIGYGALTSNVSGSGNTAVGVNALLGTTGSNSCAFGSGSLDNQSTGTNNSAFGFDTLGVLGTTSNNSAFGSTCLANNEASNNCGFGYFTLASSGTGAQNSAFGTASLPSLGNGNYNCAFGYNAGSAYTGVESSNVIISNPGVVGESNVLRLGTQGSGNGQQNVAYIVGTLNISGAITTLPVASSTATTAFGTSLTLGTAVQNTTGYDILVNISVIVMNASGGALVLGVGPTSTPTTNTVTGTFTVVTTQPPTNFSAIVPNSYYLLVNTTGTITVSSVLTQVCPL